MSQYIFLKQANGEFLKLLADDDGIIQYTTNGDAFTGIAAGSAAITTDATLSGDGSSGDPLTVLSAPTATTATTAAGPTVAGTFLDTLTAAVDTITTLGVDGNTMDVTGLTGNADGDYEFEGVLTLTGNASANNISFQPNASAGNQVSNLFYSNGAAVSSAATNAFYIINPTNTADSKCYFRGMFSSKTGRDRVFTCEGYGENTGGASIALRCVGGWSDTSNALTSIRITSDHGLRAGSFIRVRRLRNLT